MKANLKKFQFLILTRNKTANRTTHKQYKYKESQR